MAKDEQDGASGSNNESSQLARFSGIAFQMIVVIGVFAFAGIKLDALMGNTTKWATAGLSLVGVFIALYIIIKSIRN